MGRLKYLNIVKFTPEGIKKINDVALERKKLLAHKVSDELYNAATYAIDMFYAHYKPIYYRRHYWNFEKNSFSKYYKNPHNSIIRGGVRLSASNMSDIYQDPKQEVFDFVYQGFHGVASAIWGYPERMIPTPLDIIYEEQQKLIKRYK